MKIGFDPNEIVRENELKIMNMKINNKIKIK